MLGALRLTRRLSQTTIRAPAALGLCEGSTRLMRGLGGEQRTMSVLALGSAHSRGLPAHSLLPAAPVALASPAAGPSWTGGLLGACRDYGFSDMGVFLLMMAILVVGNACVLVLLYPLALTSAGNEQQLQDKFGAPYGIACLIVCAQY